MTGTMGMIRCVDEIGEQVRRLLPGAVFGKADIDTIMQFFTGRDTQ